MDAEPPRARAHRRGIAAGILAASLAGAWFVTAGADRGGSPGRYLLNVATLAPAFWFPALRLTAPRDLLRQAAPLLAWLLGWALTRDLAIAGLLDRPPFRTWWIAYPGAVALLLALLLLHTIILTRWTRNGRAEESRSPTSR